MMIPGMGELGENKNGSGDLIGHAPGGTSWLETYAAAARLALNGQPEDALAQTRNLTDADGLRLLAQVLSGQLQGDVPLDHLPRLSKLDPAIQSDFAYRLVAAAHASQKRYLEDHGAVALAVLNIAQPNRAQDHSLVRLEGYSLDRVSADHGEPPAEAPELIAYVGSRLELSEPTAEGLVAYLLSWSVTPEQLRKAVDDVRLAPALPQLSAAVEIIERLHLTELTSHLGRAFDYPPHLPDPDLSDLPVEERFDVLFRPDLFDNEVRAAKDQSLWLALHLEGHLDHDVIRARRAEFLIWAEDDDAAVEVLEGTEHPLCRAMLVKAMTNIARDGGNFPASLYREARQMADDFRDHSNSHDPLIREAMLHKLEMLAAIAYYYDEDPETANYFAIRALQVAEELGMKDKSSALASQIQVTNQAQGLFPVTNLEPVPESGDPKRQQLHAVTRLVQELGQRQYGNALEIAESHLGTTHIPLLVKAIRSYANLDYWGSGVLLQEAEFFRSDFQVLKALLTLQTFARVGEVAYANPQRALVAFGQNLAELRAPFERLTQARTIFPLGLLLAAAHHEARGDVKREAARVPIMRLNSEGRSGSWRQGKLLAVVPPGALEDII